MRKSLFFFSFYYWGSTPTDKKPKFSEFFYWSFFIVHGWCNCCALFWRIFKISPLPTASFWSIDFVLCILRTIGSAANCRNKHDTAMQSQVVCNGCRTLLRYPRGHTQVRCAICSTITPAAPGTSFASFDISWYHITESWLWKKNAMLPTVSGTIMANI